jgi:hypothetical protein
LQAEETGVVGANFYLQLDVAHVAGLYLDQYLLAGPIREQAFCCNYGAQCLPGLVAKFSAAQILCAGNFNCDLG